MSQFVKMGYFCFYLFTNPSMYKNKARIKAKQAAGLLGKMPVQSGCYIMSRNGIAYRTE